MKNNLKCLENMIYLFFFRKKVFRKTEGGTVTLTLDWKGGISFGFTRRT